jgi:uncharacterized protein YlbG (UPF0298 family)
MPFDKRAIMYKNPTDLDTILQKETAEKYIKKI